MFVLRSTLFCFGKAFRIFQKTGKQQPRFRPGAVFANWFVGLDGDTFYYPRRDTNFICYSLCVTF
jgi:hypothetical protein